MDITETLAAKSEQINADDLLNPVTVTVTGVSRGEADQPVNVELAEFPGRTFRPCKSMRRVLALGWGKDASTWIGHRMVLFNDPTVKWGGQAVGGIRIKAMSHIPSKLSLALTVTRGQRKPYVVDPLPGGPPPITEDTVADLMRAISEAATLDELKTIGTDLKAWDLGAHKQALQTAWADRSKAIKAQEIDQ